jgi:DNA-binding transcriptional regulator YiaG
MPNIAAVLKEEIARLARKELRKESEALKKTTATLRAQLAAAKKQLQEQDRMLKALTKSASKAFQTREERKSNGLRFSPARLAAQRKRLGISAELFGRLIGTSGQSIYLWERGKTRPSPENLAAIASLRRVGKRDLA